MSDTLIPQNSCVLVTGGAGFIGSHTVVELLNSGYEAVIVDDLSNASAKVIDRIKTIVGEENAKRLSFYEADVNDADALNHIFDEHAINFVIHFAGFKAVGESVTKPIEYYTNNLGNTLTLLDVMRNHGCKSIIFSSSATVYGDPDSLPLTEQSPKKNATNPYGWTKWMIEQILTDVHTADPEWNVVLLRYFNPIGAHQSGLIGEDPAGIPNNLVPYVAQVAVGKREAVHVFGDDYNTPDGTGVRDYIHVCDLGSGHVAHLNGWLAAQELKSSTWALALVARYLTLLRRSQRPAAKRFLTLLSLAAQVTLQPTTPTARKLLTCLAGRLSTTSPTCAAILGSGSR